MRDTIQSRPWDAAAVSALWLCIVLLIVAGTVGTLAYIAVQIMAVR